MAGGTGDWFADEPEGTGWFGTDEGGMLDTIGDLFLGQDDNPDTIAELLNSEGGDLSEAMEELVEDIEGMVAEMAGSEGQQAILDSVDWGGVAGAVLSGGDYMSDVQEMVGEGFHGVADIMGEVFHKVEEFKSAAASDDWINAGISILSI